MTLPEEPPTVTPGTAGGEHHTRLADLPAEEIAVLVADGLPVPVDVELAPVGRELLERHLALEAVDVLRQAVARGEDAFDLLVRAYLDSGGWAETAALLEPLVEQGRVEYAGRLGVALAELDDRERAEDVLRLAVRGGELAAANDLALLLRTQRRDAEALRVLRYAAEVGDGQAQDNLVAFLLEAGELPEAVAAAERYADEARPDTLVALADVRAAAGRDADAAELYRRADRLGALRAHTAHGTFLLSRGDLEGAEREFREAERHNEPGWAYTMGRFLIDTGRSEEARPYLEMGVRWGDRDCAEALDLLDGIDPTDD